MSMLHSLKIVSGISDTINRIIDQTGRDKLEEAYYKGGLSLQLTIENTEMFVLLRPKCITTGLMETEQEGQEEAPETLNSEPGEEDQIRFTGGL